MTNIRVLIKKISEIEKYFQKAKKFQKYSQKEIKNNDDLMATIERYLYLLCQATIDLAEAVISYHSFRMPANYGEIFRILQENDLINRDLTEKMIKMTGFRNVLAHAYGEVDFEKLYIVLTKDVEDIDGFVKKIKKKINI